MVAAMLLGCCSAHALTYTFLGSETFTDSLAWNFGAGPVPASDAGLALSFATFGSGGATAANDLNLTFSQLDLSTFGRNALTLASALGGDFAFTGAGKINLLGSGAATTLSAPVVLAQGLTSLTIAGTGPSGLVISGVISSNTSAGAPLVIDASRAEVSLSGANTFSGGVALNSGTLSLNSASALGARTNTLTINGGSVRASVAIANDILLNATLTYSGSSALTPATLSGVLSGSGGVANEASGTVASLALTGANSYTGATTVRGRAPSAAAVDGAGIITIDGAAGSILNTSGIGISEGGAFRLNYSVGHSSANSRVSTATAIIVGSGFLEVIGNSGLVRQSLGTVNAGGLTTILAATNGAAAPAAGAAMEVTIGNLVRAPGSSVTFTGPGLGLNPAAPGLAAAQGNVLLTQINGLSPGAVLVGGGLAGTPGASIFPWAVGDTANSVSNYGAGAGFVTLGVNGVRLLDTATEYNSGNDFVTAGATDNMRITGTVTNPAAARAVNSMLFATAGQTIGGPHELTVTSGTLASTVATATISAPLNFGPEGEREGVVSVIGGLATANVLTLSGPITATGLVKSGHGMLELNGTGNVISGPITINGGSLQIDAVARLGGATSLFVNGHSSAAQRGALIYTGVDAETLGASIAVHGAAANFEISAATGSLMLGGPVSGAGAVRKDGTGVLSLGGTNTYVGGTILGNGTLVIDSDARLGAAAGPLVLNRGTLRLTADWASARAVSVGAAVTLDSHANHATLSGPISGNGTLSKIGAGTLTITGADNGFSGILLLGNSSDASGPLVLSGAGALSLSEVRFGPDAAGVPGMYVLDLSGATAPSGTPWRSFAFLTTGSGFIQPHEVKLGANSGAPVDFRVGDGTFGGAAGVISGFGKLVKVGAGTLTLDGSAANTFTGGAEIWGGTLVINADPQLGDPGNGLVIQGGTLSIASNITTTRAITLGATPQPIVAAGVLQRLVNRFDTRATTLQLDGPIGGAGGFNVTGYGTLVLRAANHYAGDTQITNSFVNFTDDSQLGAASSRVRLDGGTLQFAATPTIATTYPVNRTIILTADSGVNVASSNATVQLNGPLVGAGILTKSGAGRFVIPSDSTSFFGTLSISNGNASLTGAGQLRRGTVTLNAGSNATFSLNGLTRELNGLQIATGSTVALGAGGKVTTGFGNANLIWNGSITGDGAALVSKVGSGTLTITSGANTFGGGFHLLSGAPGTFTPAVATLSGSGALPLQSAFTIGAWGDKENRGPFLLLSNTATNLASRLADSQIIHSNSGGFQFAANASAPSSETVGSLRGAGMTVVANNGPLTFADQINGLVRINRGTFSFGSNIFFGNLPGTQLIGGGGGAGTTTASILPYAVGGASLVTYGASGTRVLDTFTEFNRSLTAAGATENVRVAAAALTTITLAGGADKTVNSLILGPGSQSTLRIESAVAEKLILSSGVLSGGVENVFSTNLAGTAGVPLGVQTAELQTGAGNTRELHVFAAESLAIGARVTTSGGITKSGQSHLFLTNPANTYTGPTTVNAGRLAIDDLRALGGSATLQLGGGFLKYRGSSATLTQSVIAAGGEAANPIGGSAGIDVVSGTTLIVRAGGVSGFGGIFKEGRGVLKLQGNNTNSGATLIGRGVLAIDAPGALGTNGRVVFVDGSETYDQPLLRFDAPMTLTQDFITNGGERQVGFGFDTAGHDVTLSGTLLSTTASANGLTKFGIGELNLTATQMFTTGTLVYGGTLRLSGANGSLRNGAGDFGQPAVQVFPGAALVLDNTAANHPSRLPNGWDTPFGVGEATRGAVRIHGGELRIVGNATGSRERINRFEIDGGTVTLSGGGVTVVSGLFSRLGAQSAGLLRGTNLGAAPSPASANWFVTDLGEGGVRLTGAGGAEGTPFVNILPGFLGDKSATGSGTDLLTYASDTGFRLLGPGEYTSAIPARNFDPNRAPNIALAGSGTVDLTTGINALKLGSGSSLSGSGTLALFSSTVLVTGNASIATSALGTHVASANPGYVFLTPGADTTLTVGSLLPSAGLTKHGTGTLVLNGAYIGAAAGAPIVVGQGTLRLGSASAALNPIGNNVVIQPGATFDLGGSDRVIGSLGGSGTVSLGANRLTLYDYSFGTFAGQITGSGGLTSAFNLNSREVFQSPGTNTFIQPLSYSGTTRILGGVFELARNGSLPNTSSIEVRGGTLLLNNRDDYGAAGGSVAQRIAASTPITMAGGGLVFREPPDTVATHMVGPITLAGGGMLTVEQSVAGTGAPATIRVADVTRGVSKGTLTVRAQGLGLAQSPTGNARIFLTQVEGGSTASALIGGGGAPGTTTVSILPWVGGFGLFTHGAEGLRPLATSEYETNVDAPSSPFANVRTPGAQTLTASRTVNALRLFSGNIAGAFDLTLGSGALATAGTASNLTVTTNGLLTGAGNTRELLVHVTTGDSLTLNTPVTTSGGVTKIGPNNLTLGGTNTFTGGLTINEGTVNFTADRHLGEAGGAVRFGGSISSGALAYTGAPGTPLAFNRPIETASLGLLSGVANHRWQLNQPISGSGGIRYSGPNAIFEINAVNTYAGVTDWVSGHLYFSDDSALGSGGELSLSANPTQHLVLRGDWASDRLIHANRGSIQTNGRDTTWSGALVGGSTLGKNGMGTLHLTAPMPYAGTLVVNAGSVRLAGQGSLAGNNQTHIVNAGAALILDDTVAHLSDRLHDSAGGVTLAGGEFVVRGNANVPTEEVINSVVLSGGSASTMTVAAGSGSSAVARLTGVLAINPGAAALFRGTNFGMNAPGSPDSASIFINSGSTALIGGGARSGHPSVSVVAGGFGDTDPAGLGSQLVTYDAERGIRLLDPNTEYTATLENGSIVTDSAKAHGIMIGLAHATTANALWLKDGGSITGGGTLRLTSGGLLASGPGNSVANPIFAGTAVLAVGGPGDVSLDAAIPASQTGGLAKLGAGTLTLSIANSYTGPTILAAGVVAVRDAAALSATTVRFQGGEIRNTSAGPVTLANDLTLSGPLRVGGAQALTFSGAVSLANATRQMEITNTGGTTLSGVISSSQTLINYGLTKSGAGLLILGNPANTYDGETTVASGELRVTGSIAGSVLTTVAGGTLSGSGTVGALRVAGGTLAPGPGAATLMSGDVTFGSGTFSIEITSAAAATRLNVTGSAGLSANTVLTINLADGYDPAPGDNWTLLDNDGADPFALGSFRFTNAGKPIEPLVAFTAGGEIYHLDYAGGTGNDVVLTHVPEPSAIALLLAAVPLLGRRRRK